MTPLDNTFQESDFDFVVRKPQNNSKASNTGPLQIHHIGKENEQPETQTKDYRVSHVFYPIILVSKVFGFCPVKIQRKGNEILYEFKWISVQFCVSLLWSIVSGAGLFIWILNSIFNVSWPTRLFSAQEREDSWLNENLFKGSQLVGVLNNLIKVLLPIGAWFCLIFSWGDVRSLCTFLNEWSTFIHKYNAVFSSYHSAKFPLARNRNAGCVFWFTPVVVLMFTIKPHGYLEGNSFLLNFLFGHGQIVLMLGTRALSYVKDFLLLQTVRTAYDETLNGIKAEYGKCQKAISRDQVREWMDMVSFIRQQAGRLESHISCQNLWSVFEIFTNVLLILSMAVFLFMNNALSGSLNGNFLPFSLVSTAFFICSLFWKTEIAEQIASKEEEIAEELLEMETADDDCETRLEMKLICDVIYNDPVKIQVGNVLTLNKRLLLSFFSQLASYLVVILQFTKT